MERKVRCELADGFRLRERLYAQVTFVAMGVLGTLGIFLEDPLWVLPYAVVYWYGIPGIVMSHLNCPRCPHLHHHGDCLQAPVWLTRFLAGEYKATPFSSFEKVLFYTIFVFIPLYPLHWLRARPLLMVAFVLVAAMWYAGQLFYFCKRCRLRECPFNRVPAIR